MGCGSVIDARQNSIVYSIDKLVQDIQKHQILSNKQQKSSVFESVFESSIQQRSYQQSQENQQQIAEKSLELSLESPVKSVVEINLEKKERREINTNYNYPYDCIVKLSFFKIDQSDSNKSNEITGTGVLVSPEIILTSGHFIQEYQNCKGQSTKINAYLPGKSSSTNPYEADFQCLMPDYCKQLQLIQYDFGFVKLKRSIVRQKYISIALNFRFINYPAELCGFTAQRKQMKMKGLIENWAYEYIEYLIDSSKGQSGSPLLIKIQSGQYYMISSHSGFYFSFIENGKKVKFKKKQSQISNTLVQKFQQGHFQQDKGNSGCRLTDIHKDFLIASLKSKLSDMPKEKIDKIIAKIKFVDLSKLPEIKFPKQYYKKGIEAKQKNAEVQRREFNSIKIQRSKVTELQSNVVSAIPTNDDMLSTLKTAKKLLKQSKNHQSLIQCHKAYAKIKENNLLRIQFLDLIGSNYQQLHSPHIAKIYYKKCAELAQTVQQQDIMKNSDFLSIIKIFHNLGVMELEVENIEKAKKFFEKCQKCLFKKNKDKIEHYAATVINLSLILIRQKNQDPFKIIDRLKASLGILQSISNQNNKQIIGKIQAIRNILMILFQQGKYEEWLELILEQMETIVQMKMEEGIYNRFDSKPVESSYIKELHRVKYESTQPIERHNYLPTYFVSWKQELLEQAEKILKKNDIEETFQLKLGFAIRELFKGLAGEAIAAIQKKIRSLKTKKQVKQQQ